MAVLVPDRTFEDPYGGVVDLAHRVLRTPGRPEDSFSDDPLRMMRAARFAAQLGFAVDPSVVAAMTAMADRIEIISAERVRDELVKLVCGPYPRLGLTLLVETGLAERVLPELPALALERDEHHRHKDVYEHTLTVLEQAIELEHRLGGGPDFVVRFAALMHDVGKPRTRRFLDDGTVTFHHHDVVGAKMTRKRMKALRFSNDDIDAVSQLVELHLRFHGYGDGEWTDSAVRRYVRDAGDQLERLHILTRADCTTRNQRKAERLRRTYDDLEERIARLSEEEELASIRPDLDGNQIMEVLGIGPGREVGAAYRFLLDLRLEHGPQDEETAKAALLDWWTVTRVNRDRTGRAGVVPGMTQNPVQLEESIEVAAPPAKVWSLLTDLPRMASLEPAGRQDRGPRPGAARHPQLQPQPPRPAVLADPLEGGPLRAAPASSRSGSRTTATIWSFSLEPTESRHPRRPSAARPPTASPTSRCG